MDKSAFPVTVLMAVYNDARFLPVAVESILGQSFGDFRFLIVDDCSTDETPRRLASYQDPRMEVIRLEKNIGQTAALNVGLKHAQSPWIARMDADDYSSPERLARQMEAVAQDASLRCVGTGIWEFKEDPTVVEVVKVRPEEHEAIKRAALHGSGMIHGSILVSREALSAISGYDERYRYAADRDLFIRLFFRYRAMNLQEPLLGVRRHREQDSFSVGAANEYIAIFSRLVLQENGFSNEEQEVLRCSLAWSHLFRSWCFRQAGDWPNWLGDQLRGWKISWPTASRNLINGTSHRLLSASVRKRLQEALGGRERATFRVR